MTNKPDASILQAVAHHLIDVICVQEEFNVGQFNRLALEAIDHIHARARVPLVVGGSGLYMQVLLDGIFSDAEKNESVRQRFKEEARIHGTPYLYAQLKESDPQAAARIHPNDERRIVRALEVYVTCQQRISILHKNRTGLWGKYAVEIFALTLEREVLYSRINQRVDRMFANGAVDEIRDLQGVVLSPTAGRLIGVREIQGYLAGEYDENRARELMKLNTRRLAKRQLTWFRKEKRAQWITLGKEDPPEAIADQLMKRLN